ncbi:MAG: DNA-directed RNA polymerase subunit P [Candidatus Methanofastidiosia archaeon]
MYKCISCGKVLEREKIEQPFGVMCPFCNNRIFKKVRPDISKKVKAV